MKEIVKNYTFLILIIAAPLAYGAVGVAEISDDGFDIISNGKRIPRPSLQRSVPLKPLTSNIKPHYCEYILSKLIDARGEETKLQEIASLVEEAKKIQTHSGRIFTDAGSLALLFDRGLIFEAMGKELRERRNSTTSQMETALNLLASNRDRNEQIQFITAVVDRMIKNIGAFAFSMNDARLIEKRAADLSLTPSELTDLLQVLRSQEADGFVILKIALYQEIFDNGRDLKPFFDRASGGLPSLPSPTAALTTLLTIAFMPHHFKRLDEEGPSSREVTKILRLKMNAFKTQIAVSDDDLVRFFDEFETGYGSWLNREDFQELEPQLWQLLGRLNSQEKYSKYLKLIVRISKIEFLDDAVLASSLEALIQTYYKTNNPRYYPLQLLKQELVWQPTNGGRLDTGDGPPRRAREYNDAIAAWENAPGRPPMSTGYVGGIQGN